MNPIRAAACAAIVSILPCAGLAVAEDQADQPAAGQPAEARLAGDKDSDRQMSVEQATADWPAGPKKALKMMTGKYGPPDAVSATCVMWTAQGPFREIILLNQEIQHDFPMPHKDYLEHVIACKVPVEKVGELAKYDGSVIVDRTRGVLSARCDTEAHNILALNLAKQIIDGSIDAKTARMQFGKAVMAEKAGKPPEILIKLQFEPEEPGTTGDLDMALKPAEPGEAQPASAKEPAADEADVDATEKPADSAEEPTEAEEK